MKFVADESIDAPIFQKLRENGFDTFSIAEQCPGIRDERVLAIAHESASLLITQDKDFGELVHRLGKAHHGVVLLRMDGLSPYEKADHCLKEIHRHRDELPGAFTVINKNATKIRKRPW
ncbi:DUF5615 family PIN-like protein [Chitinophaga japonensis]|uniref:Putative nuclease of predicted toxin-antitoxin system n=1 Tax=Chitinophaga japonensis TaxID=104662 RepID=A0A562T3Y5_CHIJA|nr:DUF5615 family PIN-like protein [Chitinophaga japonensis]TWI88251.1 putative nuclease of predicted toxin-antitoxin system [Chitinophaga japonensis]